MQYEKLYILELVLELLSLEPDSLEPDHTSECLEMMRDYLESQVVASRRKYSQV